MSTQITPVPRKRRFSKKAWWLIGIGAFVMLLGVAWVSFVIYAMGRLPKLNGSITIKAGSGSRLFLGEEYIGTGEVTLPLDKAFAKGRKSASPPNAEELAKIVADGKEVLRRAPGGSTGSGWGDTQLEEFILRDTDGKLDQVFVLTYSLRLPDEPPACYVLLLRVRGLSDQGSIFFACGAHGSTVSNGLVFLKAFGKSPSEWKSDWSFTPTIPPEQFKEALKTKGMWEPTVNR